MEPRRLIELIKDARLNGASEEFAGVIITMATGLIRRYRFHLDEEEYVQECFVLIASKLWNFDLRRRKRIFNFMTTLCWNQAMIMLRSNKRRFCYPLEVLQYCDDPLL